MSGARHHKKTGLTFEELRERQRKVCSGVSPADALARNTERRDRYNTVEEASAEARNAARRAKYSSVDASTAKMRNSARREQYALKSAALKAEGDHTLDSDQSTDHLANVDVDDLHAEACIENENIASTHGKFILLQLL